MGRNKGVVEELPDGIIPMNGNGQEIISDETVNETGDLKAGNVSEDTDTSENEKEEEMLTVAKPIKQENIVEKSFVDITQNAKIEYLHVGMKFLVGKMSNEEQRNFYLNFPELR